MSKLLEFFLGSILIAVFTVALMFFSVLQYVLRVGSSDNCAWYGSAKIWLDSNGDGQLNRGEPPLADVEIHVDDVGNGLVDIGWPAITDKDGEALLNVQIPGCSDTVFEIYVDAPEGYQITTQPRIQVNPDALQTAEVEPVYYFGFASAR